MDTESIVMLAAGAVLVGALAVFLLTVAGALIGVRRTLRKVAGAFESVEQQTRGLEGTMDQIREDVAGIGSALEQSTPTKVQRPRS